MEFRWVAGLTLWTILSGPVLVEWTGTAQSWFRQSPQYVQRNQGYHPRPPASLVVASEERATLKR